MHRNRLGGCCALLLALACGVAVGEDRADVKTAFLDSAYDGAAPRTEPLPAPPAPSPAPRLIDSSESGDPVATEADHPPDSISAYAADHVSYYEPYFYPSRAGGRWPLAERIRYRYITHYKPALQASHWGYPEYFEERPFGSYVLQGEQMQITNGLQDQQVLYHYDFFAGDRAATLSPRGEYQLKKIIRRMEIASCPIVIQTAIVNPELDEARRESVLEALRAAGVAAVPDMVVIDHPPLPGLAGEEGWSVYGNLLGQTRARGGGFEYTDIGGGRPTAIFFGTGFGVGTGRPSR